VAEHVDRRGDVADDVVRELYRFHDTPGTGATLVARRQEDRISGLRRFPVVLEQVRFDAHAARVLELEEILDLPRGLAPRHRPRELVVAEDHVTGHEARNRGIGAAEQEHFAGRLQVVVLDREGARTVPARDGLRVHPLGLDVTDVAIADGDG
jgi:hypothetical protein